MTMIDKMARAIFDAAPFRDSEGSYEAQSDGYRALYAPITPAPLLRLYGSRAGPCGTPGNGRGRPAR